MANANKGINPSFIIGSPQENAKKTVANTTEANDVSTIPREVPSNAPCSIPLDVHTLGFETPRMMILAMSLAGSLCHSQQFILNNISGNVPSDDTGEAPLTLLALSALNASKASSIGAHPNASTGCQLNSPSNVC